MTFFESEETKSVLNTIGENIFIVDKNLKIVWVNDYASALLEKLADFIDVGSKEDLIGKDISRFHRNHAEKQEKILAEGPFPYEAKINLFNYYTANLVVNPLYAGEELKGYVLTWKDVTEYERELTDVKVALDKSSVVAIIDREGLISYVNDKFCELSKYKRDEVIGQEYNFVNAEDYSQTFYGNVIESLHRGEIWRGELKQQAKDGSDYWVVSTVIPFMDADVPYQYAVIQQDITARKQAEEMLHTSEKLAVMGELAAGVAHEIRNPLTTIKGFTQFSVTNEDHKAIMLNEIERIDTIINEFMMLARPHAGVHKLVNLIRVIESVIHFLTPESHLKNVEFILDSGSDEVMLHCEESQMKQVFLNLFKNAVESMDEGGKVTVKVRETDRAVTVAVKDEGRGLTEEEISKLGEPFYSLKKEGTGLGLMMTFRIIENHSGMWKVDSIPGKGTTFRITLPVFCEENLLKAEI